MRSMNSKTASHAPGRAATDIIITISGGFPQGNENGPERNRAVSKEEIGEVRMSCDTLRAQTHQAHGAEYEGENCDDDVNHGAPLSFL